MPRRSRRSVYDIVSDISGRDAQAHREVAAILSVLPEPHPARVALDGNRSTVELTHYVSGRQDLLDELIASHLAYIDRSMGRAANLSTSGFLRNAAPPAQPVHGPAVYCRHCRHWAVVPGRGSAPLCRVLSPCAHHETPSGCVQYEREPGADDE